MNWVRLSGVLGLVAVALGAFGAHALRGKIPDAQLHAYQTGVSYHLVHAIALFALALYGRISQRCIVRTASLWFAGIALFSGSLYAMALTGWTSLGIITPFGGSCLLAGWAMVAFGPLARQKLPPAPRPHHGND